MTMTATEETPHTCPQGPLCAYWHSTHYSVEDPGGCVHDSCMGIVHDFQCRACQDEVNDADANDLAYCVKHGYVAVSDSGSTSGFAGGTVNWAQLACGCFDMDETGDMEAAR